MNFEDFFSADEGGYPYEDAAEINECYLRFYDMLLAAGLELTNGSSRIGLQSQIKKAKEILRKRALTTDFKALQDKGVSLLDIKERFLLSDFEFLCLIIAYAQETDGRYQGGYSFLTDDETLKTPNVFFVKRLLCEFCDTDCETIDLEKKPLFNVFKSPKGKGSLYDSFELSRDVADILKGNFDIRGELKALLTLESGSGKKSTLFHKDEEKELSNYLKSAGDEPGKVINIYGAKGSGKRELILSILDEDKKALFLDLAAFDKRENESAPEILKGIIARAHILSEDLVIDAGEGQDLAALKKILLRAGAFLKRVFVISTKRLDISLASEGFDVFGIKLSYPTAREQESIWKSELSKYKLEDGVNPSDFSGKYRLHYEAIKRCAKEADAIARAEGKKKISFDHITRAVLDCTTSDLDRLSDRIPLKFSYDDLVIDDSQMNIIKTLVSRVKNRNLIDEEWGFGDKIPYGKGVSLILYGPPGTGKTMAAQVMAKEIGMALYRVDLSQLVDKYVGETEKNIGKIFDAASDGNVILFFDEADALFSRRTEVTSSNDKHANTEVAYLLQKIEQHDGVTLLATNRFSDFDSAFVRRITYAVKLDKPDADKRLMLFEKILPDKTPRDKDLDLKFFADSFELSGSEIKEVLYSAAFIAASEGGSLSNRHLSQAIKYQQEKAGKVLQGADFARYLN